MNIIGTNDSEKAGSSLPLRRVIADLRWVAAAKSLMTFLIFYVLVAALSFSRMDTTKGHETLEWLNEAHDRVGTRPLDQLSHVDQISRFYQDGLPKVVDAMVGICSNCALGLTPQSRELAFLGLESFICSGFASTIGSGAYPARDCAKADALWAAHPSSKSAPCCHNATLVTASLSMMTESLEYGIDSLPLHTLLHGGSDPSYNSVARFVSNYVDTNGFLMQLVISQDQRMAAAQYYATWTNKVNAPGRVATSATFWSFNYSDHSYQRLLQVCMLLALAATFVQDRWLRNVAQSRLSLQRKHEQRRPSLLSADGGPPTRNGKPAGSSSSKRASRGFPALQWYVLVIELPSTIVPLVLEVARPFMSLPTWAELLTISEMLLAVRLFHDAGQVVPPIHRINWIFQEALPNIIAYVVSLTPVVLLTALSMSARSRKTLTLCALPCCCQGPEDPSFEQ